MENKLYFVIELYYMNYEIVMKCLKLFHLKTKFKY